MLPFQFRVTEGDVLTRNVRNKSGKRIVEDIFKNYLQRYSLKREDFIHIFFVCDIDGSYFPQESIINDDTFDEFCKPAYTYAPLKNKIFACTKKRDAIVETWSRKRERQNQLVDLPMINGVPFKIYYNSFFLEHVLCRQVDIRKDQKEEIIDSFLDHNDLQDFIHLLEKKSLSLDYFESWKLLRQSDFTLFKSYSNMLIMFNKLDELFNNRTDND